MYTLEEELISLSVLVLYLLYIEFLLSNISYQTLQLHSETKIKFINEHYELLNSLELKGIYENLVSLHRSSTNPIVH